MKALLGRAAAVAVLVAVATGTASAATGAGGGTAVPRTQALAVVLAAQTARSAPDGGSPPLQAVAARRPITGERTVLPVVGSESDPRGARWLHVLLPGRPNGHAGWIMERSTRARSTSWHIVVDTSERRMTVYRNGRAVRTVSAVVGKASTPTPVGQFFVEEDVQLGARAVGGPFALALSARSDVLQEFAGGPGQIALHGMANIGGPLGSAVSHGCVRLDGAMMRWLVVRIGPGVPVTVES